MIEFLFFGFYSFNLPRFSLIVDMEILESSSELSARIHALKEAGKVIGFVLLWVPCTRGICRWRWRPGSNPMWSW
ncbi:hypothetical protein [Geofilum rubicundum]|uniref:Uncharacterized protein n=1 Tax=Geofilum rubicundum JCM 15548 TaxID=1236989 RepID=A0A0E9LXA1_9BACT|nr:hypothetical protein [Geofilum rubicundum]GAO29864.1 hypothetical protein JCM15548_12095 [Geofilum rubicundum JCM 15548]